MDWPLTGALGPPAITTGDFSMMVKEFKQQGSEVDQKVSDLMSIASNSVSASCRC